MIIRVFREDFHRRYIPVLFTILALLTILPAQNTDLSIRHASGRFEAMAGAGMGIAAGIDAFDLNPAGLAGLEAPAAAIAFGITLYDYELLNTRFESSATGSRLFEWRKVETEINSLALAFPLSKRITVGAAIAQRINAFTHNVYRAITWSPLIYQTTRGGLYDISLAAGIEFNPHLALGGQVFRSCGSIRSEIVGDNHGADKDKWARLEHRFEGYGASLGLQLRTRHLCAGATFRSAVNPEIKISATVSADKLYKSLLPSYESVDWALPAVLALGLAYRIEDKLLIALDFESQPFERSEIRINLFEYNGQPDWTTLRVLRAGIEYRPLWALNLPLRFGYAVSQQHYASIEAEGIQNTIIAYSYGAHNRKQLISTGTTLTLYRFVLDLALHYAWLRSERNFQTGILVEDNFTERDFSLSMQIRYSL